MARAAYKLTKRFQKLIVQRSIEGFGTADIHREIQSMDLSVSEYAIRHYRIIYAREISVGLERQWERGIAVEPDFGLLENRLRGYREVVEREEQKERPSNTVILNAISAAAADMHKHEENLIRFKSLALKNEESEDAARERKERELEDLKRRHQEYLRSIEESDRDALLLEMPEDSDDGESGSTG